jgi:integrase
LQVLKLIKRWGCWIAYKLRWKDIDLKAKTLTIADTKNHETHTLPLSDYLHELLSKRCDKVSDEFVFPGTGIGGYIIEPRKQIAKVTAASGISFVSDPASTPSLSYAALT